MIASFFFNACYVKDRKQDRKLLWIPEEKSINTKYWNHSQHVWLQLFGLHNMFVKIIRQLRNFFERMWDIMKLWKKFGKPFEKLFWVSFNWKIPQTVNILCEISLVKYFYMFHIQHDIWYGLTPRFNFSCVLKGILLNKMTKTKLQQMFIGSEDFSKVFSS